MESDVSGGSTCQCLSKYTLRAFRPSQALKGGQLMLIINELTIGVLLVAFATDMMSRPFYIGLHFNCI